MQPKTLLATLSMSALLVPAQAARAQTLADLYPSVATILASDGEGGDQFGDAISLSGDTLAVGVPNDRVGSNDQQGSVRVFVRSGGAWTLQATLTASDGEFSDSFGNAVALSGDTLAIGAWADQVGSNFFQGSVRVFVRTGTAWTEQATLTAADGESFDQFGASVALSGDVIAVGAPYDKVGINFDRGSVHMFTRSGTTWTAQQTVTAADGATGDNFGWSVSLSGTTLAVGAPYDNVGANVDQGTVRVFARSGNTWNPQQTLTAADGAAFDSFGWSVSLDGNTLAVGVPFGDVGANGNQGTVRVFTRSGAAWSPQATLSAPEGEPDDSFGGAVALSGDTLVIGAPIDNIGSVADQGSASVYARSGATWTRHAMLVQSDGQFGDQFGAAVAVSSDAIAVGASFDDNGVNYEQGSVRLFGNFSVLNATRGIGSSTLASGIATAFSGDRLVTQNRAFAQADGTIDASQKRLVYTAVEPVALGATAVMTVASDSVFEKSPAVAAGGLTVNGRLVAPVNGTVVFQQLTVGNQGQLSQRGSSILVNQGLATTSGGALELQGIVLAQDVSTAIGGQNRVTGATDIFANYANAGTTTIERGVLHVYGALTSTGTIAASAASGSPPPAAGDGYSIGGGLIASATSSITLAGPAWWLRVGGDFDVAINSPTRFMMDRATLELTGIGPDAQQFVEALSRDLGAVESGFAPSNYLLGALRLRAGARVDLADDRNNAAGKGPEAIYTNELVIPAGATLTTNGYKVYTRVATIAGTVSNPNDIVVLPTAPPCIADVVVDGTVNGADLASVLTAWGPCSGACAGDLDRDGFVGASDLAVILSSWGACPN